MNVGYLSADCVIDNLVKLGLVQKRPDWKREIWRPSIKRIYSASFWKVQQTTSTVTFLVTVEDGIHKILASEVRFQEGVFFRKFDDVITSCKIA